MTNTPTPTRTAIVFVGTCNVCRDHAMSFEATGNLMTAPDVLEQVELVPEFECGGCGSRDAAVILASDRRDYDTVEVAA